jgi:crossover junction endodeoxyribonuclease RuvC
MFVLGIDPGLSRCGYAVVESVGRGRGRAVAMGVLRTTPEDAVPVRLSQLHTDIVELLDEFEPAVVSVERIFFQKNMKTVVGVAQASGLALALAAQRGIPVEQYSPSAVKSVVAGDGRADKGQVQRMVQLLLNLSALPQPADAADAAALALCHLAHDPKLQGPRAINLTDSAAPAQPGPVRSIGASAR